MQDSKREEFKNRLVQLCVMAVINGTEKVVIDLPSLLNLYDSEISKAREEGKLEVLEELLEWDTPLEPIGKFMRLQTKMVHMKKDLISKLITK